MAHAHGSFTRKLCNAVNSSKRNASMLVIEVHAKCCCQSKISSWGRLIVDSDDTRAVLLSCTLSCSLLHVSQKSELTYRGCGRQQQHGSQGLWVMHHKSHCWPQLPTADQACTPSIQCQALNFTLHASECNVETRVTHCMLHCACHGRDCMLRATYMLSASSHI